jgi:hypothetical protein
MRPTLTHFVILVALCCGASGCAGQQKFAFDSIKLNLPVVGTQRATLLVVDQREAVISHKYAPSFVGLYQDAPDATDVVVTASGQPFATDVSAIVADAMKRSGFETRIVTAPAGTSQQQAFLTLKSKAAEHLLLLQIVEWRSKTFKNTEINYQLTLSVFNTAGALKGEGRVKGSDQLPESHSNPVSEVNRAAERALEHKLRQLFAEPKVTQAFQRQH